MNRRIALLGILLGTLASASCADGPAVPSPVPGAAPSPAVPVSPPTPPANVNAASGLYALTLTIGSSCTAVPEAEKIRKYTARLDDDGPGRYVVTLSGATFMTGPICTISGLGCHQFRAFEEAGTIRFSLENNEWHGGYITEQMSSGTWLAITGEAVAAHHPSSMEASGSGDAWYCPVSSGSPYPCSGLLFCKPDLRLVFTRK